MKILLQHCTRDIHVNISNCRQADEDNMRPISIISCIAKIMKDLFKNKLIYMHKLNKHGAYLISM